jgi:very-short-patch-repair endonuclease
MNAEGVRHRVRVVIEVDGKQHYPSMHGAAPPSGYAEMMAEDRELRLRGHEVFRFGGAELAVRTRAAPMPEVCFDRLAARYST